MIHQFIDIIKISPCEISRVSLFKRHSPRPDHLKPLDYDEKFDAKTLAFDVFMSDDKLVFSGPPAYGLDNFFKAENFKIDGESIQFTPQIQKLDRVQRNWLKSEKEIQYFQWQYADIEFNIKVNSHQHDLFRDKKVLFTLSKNNKFEWICDWIKFYKKIHQIDAVLFYDNNSDNYSLEDLKQYLIKENLGVDIVLIAWNFKYGPQGGVSTGFKKAPWDSDFCQYGMMEHAKERFLKYAKGVINVDIDELIINEAGTSIFNDLEQYPALHIGGKWIESIPLDKNAPVLFNNFFYLDKKNYKSDYKWCISPQKIEYEAQWKVHTVRSKKLKISKNFYYLHYKAINYNWKVRRTDFVDYNEAQHRLNETLYNIIKRVFPVLEKPMSNEKMSFLERLKKKW
jgi:hypothetical protein